MSAVDKLVGTLQCAAAGSLSFAAVGSFTVGPEVVLPVLQWTGFLCLFLAFFGGVALGLLEGLGLWPLRRKGK